VLLKVLGSSFPAYLDLLRLYDANQMDSTWRYYHDGKAWLCKVQKKKKTIVWMSAWQGFMKATIYIPLKVINEVYRLDLSEERKEMIKATRDVGTSKPCTFEIRDATVLDEFNKVMQFKILKK
jgi:hypothetical protein